MTDIARKVYVAVRKDHTANSDRVRQILLILRGRFAPDSIDATYREVAKFTNL